LPSPEIFAAFAVASLALLIVPGPSVLYIVTRSMDQGRAAGLVSVLGIHTGSIVHVAAAALGLSAILASSAVWLGIRAIRDRGEERPDGPRKEHSLARVYAQGVLVNVLNPKTALFFLAFLPQFVDVSKGSVPLQAVILGATFILLGFISDSTYAVVSARISRALGARRRTGVARRWLPGLTLIGLGLAAAVTGRRPAVT
jgi:threonine/homoserine/homoserine lactone efflux protein